MTNFVIYSLGLIPLDVDNDHLQLIADLIHQIRFGLRLDRLGTWSEKLEGIRMLDLHILKLAAERPNIILKEIRHELAIPHSTLTSAINRLKKRGAIRRVISERDSRSFELELTQLGWQLREEHDRVGRMIAAIILDALSDENEKDMLIKLFSKINQGLR
jgi:DNA-binding MarR family transcriptional regulator